MLRLAPSMCHVEPLFSFPHFSCLALPLLHPREPHYCSPSTLSSFHARGPLPQRSQCASLWCGREFTFCLCDTQISTLVRDTPLSPHTWVILMSSREHPFTMQYWRLSHWVLLYATERFFPCVPHSVPFPCPRDPSNLCFTPLLPLSP